MARRASLAQTLVAELRRAPSCAKPHLDQWLFSLAGRVCLQAAGGQGAVTDVDIAHTVVQGTDAWDTVTVRFQKVLKGITAAPYIDPDQILTQGLLCNWWHRVSTLPRNEVAGRLTQDELLAHLNRYHAIVPGENFTVGQNSPFISTTAGTYQATDKHYTHFPAELTALRFATKNFSTNGYVFRAWLPVLGRPTVALEAFGEEVRDPHQYPTAYGYHRQGEVVAKIVIPPSQIEGYGEFDGPATAAALAASHPASPIAEMLNPMYVRPEDYVNVSEVV